MTTSMDSSLVASTTAADRQAMQNWRVNLPALAGSQPHLAEAVRDIPVPLQWTFGRDGCLSGLDSMNQWIGNCSLPRRASQQMLRTMQAAGHACFAFPLHPVQLEIALGILPPNQAIHAILPELSSLAMALRCCDFSAAIRGHRLYFAAGRDWAEELAATLRQHPGLPVPQNLIHTITVKADHAASFVAVAKRVFAQIGEERNRIRAEVLSSAPRPPQSPRRICLLASSRFRLWDDAPGVLADMLQGDRAADKSAIEMDYVRLDPDDPASSSHLALTLAGRECDAIITSNCTRADFPDAIASHVPVISWLTTPRIPAFTAGMANDALLLADRAWMQRARSAGWPAARLATAAWPAARIPAAPPSSAPYLAIIADTAEVTQPPRSVDYSSHGLLWELIAEEVRKDPFVLNGDIHQYLTSRMRRLSIAEEGFDRRAFVENLILPAYQQSVARLLLQAGLPVALFGAGWPALAEFAPHARGVVHSRDELLAAAAGACALIHVWPTIQGHPIDAQARPVLHPYTLTRTSFIQSARRLLSCPEAPAAAPDPLTAALVSSFLLH